MSTNVPGGTKGFAEHQHVDINGEHEKKDVRDGVTGEGQGLYEDDELKILEHTKDDQDRRAADSVQPQLEIHRPQTQSQPQPHVVRWEKFLPLRSLKVLLVENDDSTRHVVSALLRNCSYEVTAVSNGLEAWRILVDLNNQIDLVLTEVVMPGLSGIGLLSKIMSHKSCQNIPVTMMSSHDSMGIVLKCLSKGAADFLVKPIRKNELKNLWQHVWRRCHSSSGSGSESGIRMEKSIGAKNAEESDNDAGSNDDADDEDDDDTRSIGLLARDGSDNGSGTQSSWTKRAAEAESPQRVSSWDQLADPPDSTCAQVIYPRHEAFASSWLPAPMVEDGGQDNQLDDASMGKDLEIGMPRNSDSKIKGPSRTATTATSTERIQSSQLDQKIDGRNFDKGKVEISSEKNNGEWIKQATNKAGDVGNDEHHRGSMVSKIPTVLSEVSKAKDIVMENCKDLPSLELSLKSMGDVADVLTNAPEQNILGHSEISAFTRYNTGSTANQGQTGNVGSCSPLNNSSGAVKQSNSESPPNQNSNSSSNNNDMASTTNRCFVKSATAADKAPAISTVNCSQHSSAFQPVPDPKPMVSGKVGTGPVNVVSSQENHMVQLQHHHHYHHRHHHHVHDIQQLQQDPNCNDLSIKKMDGTAPQCGSSNNGRAVTETNAPNCSLNGSASGSNHGSNLHNGSSAAVNAERMNVISDNRAATKDVADNGSGSGSGSGSGVGVDQSRSAQREAALNKFRQKRKERCFEKKVRYQSRKKLAEQRPRVRGQFVRQVRETDGKDADS